MSLPRRRTLILLGCLLVFVFAAAGCESLARKFVRKPKLDDKKADEVIFAPEEYKSESVANQDLYRQYFLYWQSWQDELIDSLEKSGNRKKQVDSLNEAVKNLEDIKLLINPESAARLDFCINRLQLLRAAIVKDIYANNVAENRRQAEWIKRDISRDFSYNKIKDSIR